MQNPIDPIASVYIARISDFANKAWVVAHLGVMSIVGTGHGVMEESCEGQPDHSEHCRWYNGCMNLFFDIASQTSFSF